MKRAMKKGFTLVEILIVVIILSILAAIVIPQYSNASEISRGASLTTQLQSIRSQISLYQTQHNGAFPDLSQIPKDGSTVWDQLVMKTDATGAVYALTATTASNAAPQASSAGASPTGTANSSLAGPYLQQAPVNPFENTYVVSQASPIPTGVAGKGWVYDNTTGSIKAVISRAKASLVGLSNNNDIATY
jgi:general secretion pathway protein G